MDKLERNKRNAMAFYDLMFNQAKPREAMERQPFIDYFEKMARQYPGKKVEFKRVIAVRLDADGRVVEHWDVLQLVPPRALHDNGMF